MINRNGLGPINRLSIGAGRPGMQRRQPQLAQGPVVRPTPGVNAPPVYGGAQTPAPVQKQIGATPPIIQRPRKPVF